MLLPNEIVGQSLQQLVREATPFVERALAVAYGTNWNDAVRKVPRSDRQFEGNAGPQWDAQALLATMWDHWNPAFRVRLGLFERSLVSELREFRNRWAHDAPMSNDDAFRVADSVQRLLLAMDPSGRLATKLEVLKQQALENRLAECRSPRGPRHHARRERTVEVLLYVVACLAILITTALVILPRNLWAAGVLGCFTLLTFGYIVRKRWQIDEDVTGVHECSTCRKIIYTAECPYCGPAVSPATVSLMAGWSGSPSREPVSTP